MAYRADIEIAVRGAQELKRLQNEISATSKLVDGLNNYLENIGSGGVVRSINNLKTVVSDAAAAFDRVALNTDEAVIAARKYVTATNELNAELRERAALLKTVNEEERKNKLASAGIREITQYAGPIGPGPASPVGSLVGQKSPVAERVQRTIRARQDELDLQQALLRLEQKSAAELNKKVQSQEVFIQGTREVVALLDQQAQRQKFLAGASGTVMQGPLAGPGAMGFPVALPLTKAEQKALEAETRRQQILERMAATRQQLNGLAANLQRLEQNSAVAIADAERAQIRLNVAKTRELQLLQETAAIRNREALSSTAARQRLADDAARRRLIQDAGFGVQGPALPPTARGAAAGGRGVGGRIGGAVSSAVIGGAFPLLFGQGGGAAAGGAVGGLVGGLLGPGGGFAGSLLGTLLGDIASRGKAVKQLAEDIGFSAQQTKQLSEAFKVANTDVEKFTAVIQNIRGIGLEIEDQAKAIQLVTRLTELYGGSFEKTGNAITSALETGKVTQATLNQLTSQGINIQQALASKYDVSRDKLLKMAKDGDIAVQDLIDTLVKMGNQGVAAVDKPKSAMDRLNASVNDLGKNLTNLANALAKSFGPVLQWLTDRVTDFVGAVSRAVARMADLMNGGRMAQAEIQASAKAQAATREKFGLFGQIRALNPTAEKFYQQQLNIERRRLTPGAFATTKQRTPLETFTAPSQAAAAGARSKQGPKPPENRTKSLLADLEAIKEIAKTEDLVRDLMFQGREIAAAEVELNKTLADIERDRVKQLENANYQSEKDVINKIASARTLAAQEAVEDKIREITSQRFAEELNAQQAVRDSIKVFTDMRKEQELQAQYGKTYLRLVTEGMLPAEAERIANFEKLVTQQLSAVAEQLKITEAAILEAKARGASTVELEKQLKALKAQQEAIKEQAAKGPGKAATPTERLQDAIATARGELNNLTDPINQVIAGAAAIGDSFQQAFKGLVSGAMTGQQALAAFFKGVGDHFLDMASKMIAKLIEIYILETVVGFITGAAGAGGGATGQGGGGATSPAFVRPAVAAEGAYWPGGFEAFADGGVVTRPTMGLIGEGGEPEYVIPASKMRSAMGRYAAGARGSAVIPAGSDNGVGIASATAPTSIDVRYTVERINSVDYVTADQFQAGLQQAATQGAERGQQLALRRLQQSPSTRRRVGI